MNIIERLLMLVSALLMCLTFASCAMPNANDMPVGPSAPVSSSSQPEQEESAPSTVRITFLDGMTAREIAQKLQENGVCSADDFLSALATKSFDVSFVGQISDDERIYLPLEGYLLPDTYEFPFNEAPASVIERFLQNLESSLSDDLLTEIERRGMTLHETVTLASIIQAEALDPAEMTMISSVFHNRLASPDFPKLQSDVTIFYAKQNIEPFVSEEEYEAYFNAYSTYDCYGLPVGPICNPGLDAIKACVFPEQSDYYYFLTDHANKYYYAKTYKQHQKNWEEAKAVNARLREQSTE